jgi:hypothetical protein
METVTILKTDFKQLVNDQFMFSELLDVLDNTPISYFELIDTEKCKITDNEFNKLIENYANKLKENN